MIYLDTKYVKNGDIREDVIDLMQKTSSFKDSFDIYHICFSNRFECMKIMTFDRGFKKFINYSKTKINIL